jgi:hypothetical protein
MPTIPSGMKPVVESYAIGAPDGVSRIEVAGGLPRYSLEWDRGKQAYRVTLVLDEVQLSVWTAFFHHIIDNGSLAFDMPLDSGFGVTTHSVCIVPGTYAASRRGTATTLTFTVEAESDAYGLSEAAAEALIDAHNGYSPPAGAPQIPRAMNPVVEGYGYGGPDGVARTDIRGGASRYALMAARGPQQFRATLILDAHKFSVWTAFFHHVAKKGALSFVMDLDSGFGSEAHTVDIIPGTYGATRNGAITVVSFSVEAESTVYAMSAVDAQAIIGLYAAFGSGSSALLQRIDRFANQDTLVLP